MHVMPPTQSQLSPGCFRRYRFPDCKDCDRYNNVWERIKCFSTYVWARTDPINIELLLGLFTLMEGLTVLFSSEQQEQYLNIWRAIPRAFWYVSMIGTGTIQLVAPLYGRVRWVKRVRFWSISLLSFVWSAMGYATFERFGLEDFTCACVIFAAAASWCFLRSGDVRPFVRGCYIDCRRRDDHERV